MNFDFIDEKLKQKQREQDRQTAQWEMQYQNAMRVSAFFPHFITENNEEFRKRKFNCYLSGNRPYCQLTMGFVDYSITVSVVSIQEGFGLIAEKGVHRLHNHSQALSSAFTYEDFEMYLQQLLKENL
jgi:hypothetical protein